MVLEADLTPKISMVWDKYVVDKYIGYVPTCLDGENVLFIIIFF